MASKVNFQAPTDYSAEQENINRQRAYAQMLMQQSAEETPNGQMVSGWYVPTSPLNHLAKALKGVSARQEMGRLDDRQRQMATMARNEADQWISDMPQSRAPITDVGPSQPVPVTSQQRMAWALRGMNNPVSAPFAMEIAKKSLDPMGGVPIAHLNPMDATPESIDAMKASGDPWALRRRVTPNAELNSQLGYDKLKQALYMWENISPAEKEKFRLEAAKQGKDAFELYYKTGSFVPSYQPGPAVTGATPPAPGVGTPLPRVGGLPQPSPQAAPQPVPQPAPQPAPQAAPASVPAPIYDDQAPSEAAAMEAINDNIRRGGRGGTIYLKPGLPAAGPSLAPRPGVAPSPEQMQKMELERPQAERALSMSNSFLDTALSSIANLEKNKSGLSGVTGPIAGMLPSIAKDSSNAQSDLDALKAQLSVQGLQAMRDMSKTGGAVGQVTEKEWPRLEAMLGALGQTQTTDQFIQRLQAVKAKLMEIKSIAQKAYADTYGGPQQAPTGGKPSLDDLLRQYGG